tara:strand:- start:352 stop:870 length:519 start_codon:yes stop_codon:yes gene_type:complete
MKKLIVILLLAIVMVSCSDHKNTTANLEQVQTEANQKQLLAVQPPVRLKWSLERKNINKRTELWNSENKVSYIYLVSYGKVMAFYTIKGKVSSVNSQITNPNQVNFSQAVTSGSYHSNVLASPAEDGSYGTNGDGIFFFCTDGTYVEWSGSYMLADKPLKLASPPQLVREID